jgi:Bacterial membrane protein YfhO
LVLALIALFRKDAHRQVLPLAIGTLVSGVWMFGTLTPLGKVAFELTPKLVQGSLYPQYAMVTFCLGMACLAAMGLHSLGRIGNIAKYGIAIAVAADLIATGSERPMNTAALRQEPGFTHDQINGSTALASELRRLTRHIFPPARIDTFQDVPTWSTTAPLMGIPTANGYNPMALERLMQVRLSFAKGQRWGTWYQVEDLNSPVVDLLGIRYIITRRRLPEEAAASSKLVGETIFPGTFVYENRTALPRFWLVQRVHTVGTLGDAIKQLRTNLDPAKEAVVESDEAVTQLSVNPDSRDPREGVTVLRYHPGRVCLRVRSTVSTFLVSSEAYYPGWHAFIDGRKTRVYLTNAAFQGVVIPPGEHTVSLVFAPPIAWRSALISIGSLMILALLVFRPSLILRQLVFLKGTA